MSDNQRRIFCQLLFFLLCALPTVVTGYWICHPQTTGGWEQTLQAKLGLDTSIDSIETPGPYVTVLRGLEFSDPEIGTLLKAVEVRIEYGKNENFITVPYRVQNLTNRSLTYLVKSMNQKLIRSKDVEKPWRVQFLEDTVISQEAGLIPGSGNQGIAQFVPQFVAANAKIDIARHVDGTSAVARFNVPTSKLPDNMVVCGVSRTAEHGEEMVLDSNSIGIPCWLAPESISYVKATMGKQATFVGRLKVRPFNDNSNVSINGRFENVDLQLTDQYVSELERYGTIELEKCFFQNGSIAEWDGWLYQGNEKMRISENDLFNLTKQFAPGRAISGALIKRTARQVTGQPGELRLH